MSQQPAIGQRVRRTNDGQLGFVCERTSEDGRKGLGVRLDRKQQTIIEPWSEHRWIPEERARLTPLQVARIAYQADQALRSARGEYGVKDWTELKDEARHAWMVAPDGGVIDDERAGLYRAVTAWAAGPTTTALVKKARG